MKYLAAAICLLSSFAYADDALTDAIQKRTLGLPSGKEESLKWLSEQKPSGEPAIFPRGSSGRPIPAQNRNNPG